MRQSADVNAMMTELVTQFNADRLGCHFHDTRAMGLANVFTRSRRVSGSLIARLAVWAVVLLRRAQGNVATEDVVMMCESSGFRRV